MSEADALSDRVQQAWQELLPQFEAMVKSKVLSMSDKKEQPTKSETASSESDAGDEDSEIDPDIENESAVSNDDVEAASATRVRRLIASSQISSSGPFYYYVADFLIGSLSCLLSAFLDRPCAREKAQEGCCQH